MKRILIALVSVVGAFAFMTCERRDTYNLALLGLAPKSAIYLYQIGTSTGNAKGKNDADSQCYTMGLAYHSLIGAFTVKSFRSFSITDEMRFIVPTKYWQYPVMGISTSLTITMISGTWAGLWDGTLDNPINTTLGMPAGSYWWSGSNPDGGISPDTCGGWYENGPSRSGQVGSTGISEAPLTCDTVNYLICVAY